MVVASSKGEEEEERKKKDQGWGSRIKYQRSPYRPHKTQSGQHLCHAFPKISEQHLYHTKRKMKDERCDIKYEGVLVRTRSQKTSKERRKQFNSHFLFLWKVLCSEKRSKIVKRKKQRVLNELKSTNVRDAMCAAPSGGYPLRVELIAVSASVVTCCSLLKRRTGHTQTFMGRQRPQI